MNRFQKIIYGIAVAFIGIGTPFQLLSMYTMSPYCFLRQPPYNMGEDIMELSEIGWLLPIWVAALILVPVGAVLCLVFRKKETLSTVVSALSVVGGGLSLLVGLTLKNALPVFVGMKYDQGIDNFQFIYCYLSTVVAAALIALVAGICFYNNRQDRLRYENEHYQDQYHETQMEQP